MKYWMVLLCCMLTGSAWAQGQEEDEAEAEPLKRERVTLTYDKEQGCDLGDTIHFEAFVEREGKEGATDYSRVLYVELLSPYGEVTARKKLPLHDGRVRSELVVDTLYGTGFYELRAYTRYMTNWVDFQYFSRIVPVYMPTEKWGKPLKQGVRCLNLSSSRITTLESRVGRAYAERRDTVYMLKQPVEKNLMVFGHIEPLYKNATEEDRHLGDRRVKVFINQGKKVFSGDAETDEEGRYGLYFPDVQGEWNLRVLAPTMKGGNRAKSPNRHRITVDALFAPVARPYFPNELEPSRFGLKKWKDDGTSKYGRRFLDCESVSISMKNEGSVPMGFYAFLGLADRHFARTTGVASPTVLNVSPDSAYHKYIDIDLIGHDSADPRTVCVDGPSYDNRPIVWIVNGAYRLVTGLSKPITDFEVLRPTRKSMPIYVDEVKHVYITQDPEAFRSYVRCSVLERRKPVTVFITLHDHYVWDDSVPMSTVFEGF